MIINNVNIILTEQHMWNINEMHSKDQNILNALEKYYFSLLFLYLYLYLELEINSIFFLFSTWKSVIMYDDLSLQFFDICDKNEKGRATVSAIVLESNISRVWKNLKHSRARLISGNVFPQLILRQRETRVNPMC